jgi:alpha-1,2-mannosyltransferase
VLVAPCLYGAPMATASDLAAAVRRTARHRAVLAVFALALSARLWHLLRSGQVVGANGYDQSVYYAAADALLHGRAPYSGDFVFLHPPVVVLVGLPFALLGRLTTAYTGFLAESALFALFGALTAALVTAVARRAGAPRWGAVAGGVLYATWSVTVGAGSSVRLEPLGDLLLVTAVWLVGPGREPSRRQLVLAGVVFGVLVNVKLWWAVPLVLLFVLTAARVRRRSLVVPAVAVATAALIDLPFLLASGGRMVTSVVTAQLGRTDVQGTPSGTFERLSTMLRLERLTGVEGAMSRWLGETPAASATSPAVRVVTLLVCALVVAACLAALRTSLGRLAVLLLATQVLVLLTAPIYFPYYGDFVGVSLSLVVAASARPIGRHLGAMPWTGLLPAAAAVSLGLLLTSPRPSTVEHPWDREALAEATRGVPCIVADTPKVLIDLDALDRSFAAGCPNWVDFQGVGHGGLAPDVFVQARTASPAWRREVMRYLRSGDAVVISDPNVRVFLGPARVRALTRGPVVAESQGLVVHRVVDRVVRGVGRR